jgi:hypothetical protein
LHLSCGGADIEHDAGDGCAQGDVVEVAVLGETELVDALACALELGVRGVVRSFKVFVVGLREDFVLEK